MPYYRGMRYPVVLGNGNEWSPLALSPFAWYDPSDISTLFQDDLGTIPVTASGQSVGMLLDKSGNGNHLIQATSSLRPIWYNSSGLSWIAGDGIDDAMSRTGVVTSSVSSGYNACAVEQIASGSLYAAYSGFSKTTYTTDGTFAIARANLALNAALWVGGTSNIIVALAAGTHVLTAWGTSPAFNLQVNGATPTTGSSTFTINPNRIDICNATPIKFYGSVLGLTALSAADRVRLNTYLGNKAGIIV